MNLSNISVIRLSNYDARSDSKLSLVLGPGHIIPVNPSNYHQKTNPRRSGLSASSVVPVSARIRSNLPIQVPLNILPAITPDPVLLNLTNAHQHLIPHLLQFACNGEVTWILSIDE